MSYGITHQADIKASPEEIYKALGVRLASTSRGVLEQERRHS